jgi:tetratricopeptide (TPR) repeat protein
MNPLAVRLIALLAVLGSLGGAASGQNIVLKDGKTITAKSLRRLGNTIMATVPISTGVVGVQQTGEIGYALNQIAKIEFPRPPQLSTAPYLIVQGKPGDALAQIEPLVRYYEGFLDAPGSWWPELALIKVQALVAMGNRKDAEPLIDTLVRTATDPETVLAARMFVGATLARKGDHAKAIEEEEAVLQGATNPTVLAAAAVFKGESHLALKQYDEAVISFLQVPVFYPYEKMVAPQALLGSGRAFFAMEDFARARDALDQVVKSYGSTPQAREAQAELDKLTKREKALSGAN